MVSEEKTLTEQTPVNIKQVEDKVRNAVNAKKVRCSEYFKDFDRLRTGYITKAQFERCLDQLFKVSLNKLETEALLSRYGNNAQQKGMVCYRDFCATIDATFDANILHRPPDTQRIGSAASDPVDRQPLSPASLAKYDNILSKVALFYKYHGINIKCSYADFDKHNNGLVTESQFYRSFPGPADITEAEMRLLAKKHRHPDKAGLCNYLQFHEDVVLRQQVLLGNESNMLGGGKWPDVTGVTQQFQITSPSSSLGAIFEKIRTAVYKNGVRTTEFFRDHDKLRSGVITENQFVCGLSLCCGTIANLSRDEIQQVVDYYRTEDGRVRYKGFCDVMENAFTEPELEKKPTTQMFRPPVGALMKVPNTLSEYEERRVQEILDRLASDVRKRRLMVYPFFKDFDRSKAYTRGITKPQFERMLHVLTLNLQADELVLICKKFEYPVGGDINYPAFIQAIDPEYVAFSTRYPALDELNRSDSPPQSQRLDLDGVDFGDLIGRIRHHVLTNRIRVEEYFQDFDPLRSGSITKSHFRRGLSALGQHQLTDAQFEVLTQHYPDPKRAGNVLWTAFLTDVEEVFTKRGLEKRPTFAVPSSDQFLMDKPGVNRTLDSISQKANLLEEVMYRLRQRAKQRRLLAKPCFQDFDKHNNGHITKTQFRQCLQYLELSANVNEMEVMEEKFSDDIGVNYIRFLEALEPSEKEVNGYAQRLEELKLVNRKVMPDQGSQDIEFILEKIKTKVVKERIRILEFMRDYDKLRSGRILKTCFARALDLCQLGLTKKEVAVLTEVYTSPQDADYVDYVAFSDYIESIFTLKHLEKNPLVEPIQYRPPLGSDLNQLAPDAQIMFEQVMHRLADRVRQRRIQMFPLFEDYDRIHNGTVSRTQFNRVLSELDLGSLVSSREFTALYQKFDVLIGGKHDFNYIAFCYLIYEYAHFEHGKP